MVSVILPSYLKKYDGGATNRAEKLQRAINSFLKQTLIDKELVLISDGCKETEELYFAHYANRHDIKLISLKKQKPFSGSVRQRGIESAKGSIICYLDSDDYIVPSHLEVLQTQMNERGFDWVYFNDWIKVGIDKNVVRSVVPQQGVIGTSSIAHLKSMRSSWDGCDGYGHDWNFIQKLKSESNNYDKIYGCGYVVCHIKNRTDF